MQNLKKGNQYGFICLTLYMYYSTYEEMFAACAQKNLCTENFCRVLIVVVVGSCIYCCMYNYLFGTHCAADKSSHLCTTTTSISILYVRTRFDLSTFDLSSSEMVRGLEAE